MKVKGNADDNEGDLLLLTKDIVEKMVELQNKTKTTALRGSTGLTSDTWRTLPNKSTTALTPGYLFSRKEIMAF